MPPRKRGVAAKKRTVTFDDDTGDVVATDEAARLAADTEEPDNKNDEGDEMDADEEEEDISEFLPPGIGPEGIVFKQPVEKDPQAVPVANKNFIPLFPDASKKPKLHATAIKVYKRTPPYDGFKGKVTNIEQVDEEYLSGLWGDGIYDLELIDQMGNILRKNLGVKVAIGGGMNGGNKNDAAFAGPAVDVDAIVKRVTESAAATVEAVSKRLEADRAAEREAAKAERATEKERNDRFIAMQTTLVKEQGESMRAHYAAGAAQAAENTKALLTILTTGHQQMMQQMMAMQQSQSNGKELLQAFIAGLDGRRDDAEKDPTTTIVEGITSGLKDLRGLAEAGNKNGGGGALPATTATGITKRPAKPNPGKPAAAAGAERKEPVISKEALADILDLKKAAEARGVPFEELIKQAKAFYVNGTVPDGMLDDGDDDEDEGADETGEEGKDEDDGDGAKQEPAKPAAKPADEVEGA